MLDENLHGGVHYGEREKIRAVTRPLLVQFRRILDRGASQRVFAANIDVEKFFAAAFSLTTTCFLTGRVMSEYLPIDLQSSAGMSDWEEYAINLLFASIRPQLSRSAEHTSELQSLMRISYAVFCLTKKPTSHIQTTN